MKEIRWLDVRRDVYRIFKIIKIFFEEGKNSLFFVVVIVVVAFCYQKYIFCKDGDDNNRWWYARCFHFVPSFSLHFL